MLEGTGPKVAQRRASSRTSSASSTTSFDAGTGGNSRKVGSNVRNGGVAASGRVEPFEIDSGTLRKPNSSDLEDFQDGEIFGNHGIENEGKGSLRDIEMVEHQGDGDEDDDSAMMEIENGFKVVGEDDDKGAARTELNSDRSTFANMFISFIGAGVLGLPYAFMKTGMLGSVAVLSIVGVVSTYAMILLVQCKLQLQRQGKLIRGYGDIAFGVMGSSGSTGVDFLLILTQSAFCIAYLLFIGENLNTVLPKISNSTWVALTIPGLSLLVLYRSIKNLTPFALFADVCNIASILVVVSYDVEIFHEHEEAPEVDALKDINFGVFAANLPYFFGVAIYCFEGVGVILNIHESMQYKENFRSVLTLTMCLVTFIYVLFGVLGYIAYGADTREIITLNLGEGLPPKIVKIGLSLGLFFTYPLMMFPVFSIMETNAGVARQPLMAKNVLRILVVFGTVLVAVSIPNFGDFISLVGAGACALLALVLPAGLHLRLLRGHVPKFVLAIDVALIIFGCVLGSIGTVHAGSELLSKY